MTTILDIKNLAKAYEDVKAVDDVSFQVQPGEIVGLLGPNGAGKTTIVNMVLGILEPSIGTIDILGQDIRHNREKVMERINFAAVYAHLPGNMSVSQNLYIFSLLYGVQNPKERLRSLLKEHDLEKFVDTTMGVLSSGEQTRVALAKAFVNTPSLLLLDEPTASLDPSTAHFIREKIKVYVASNKAGVLWTSHNMHEVEAVCDRVLFLSHGKILLEGNPKTLPQEYGKKNLEELFIAVTREPLSLEMV